MARYKVTPRLNKILEERGWKQKDLAAKAGTTEATISRFDRQNRYDIETLVIISRALGLSIEDLFIIEENNEE
ncbi:helix-turn-helix domain-containing protein [Calidifontibacillus erzurumensis]|uniref:Helix-turn-helix transcriptional regulator n=1 Tax=Calidifontibacillus erzurumensis TaxID=2741433 RepID=A0A8J8GDV9_9BACI|nr:helix-turn-helix transcriptional regulator [Calidifontibacillus erzurumensis]NSL51719.1 helix-turn-helix transcriptional regulator [Calidifontibacillus erzurumensis]